MLADEHHLLGAEAVGAYPVGGDERLAHVRSRVLRLPLLVRVELVLVEGAACSERGEGGRGEREERAGEWERRSGPAASGRGADGVGGMTHARGCAAIRGEPAGRRARAEARGAPLTRLCGTDPVGLVVTVKGWVIDMATSDWKSST